MRGLDHAECAALTRIAESGTGCGPHCDGTACTLDDLPEPPLERLLARGLIVQYDCPYGGVHVEALPVGRDVLALCATPETP